MNTFTRSYETEAIVIVKASPRIGAKHGETVCCAAIDLQGNWLRLYPISFRDLDNEQKFKRWNRIRFKCHRPSDDRRVESRRVVQSSLEVVGSLKKSERERFLENLIVTSLDAEEEQERSLALLKAEILDFKVVERSEDDIQKEKAEFDDHRSQLNLFRKRAIIPHKPCPYEFKYRYRTEDSDKPREGTCQDWETKIMFLRWERKDGEAKALKNIRRVLGEEYPAKGMLLAMGTHSSHPRWLINGVVRLDEIKQLALPLDSGGKR